MEDLTQFGLIVATIIFMAVFSIEQIFEPSRSNIDKFFDALYFAVVLATLAVAVSVPAFL